MRFWASAESASDREQKAPTHTFRVGGDFEWEDGEQAYYNRDGDISFDGLRVELRGDTVWAVGRRCVSTPGDDQGAPTMTAVSARVVSLSELFRS